MSRQLSHFVGLQPNTWTVFSPVEKVRTRLRELRKRPNAGTRKKRPCLLDRRRRDLERKLNHASPTRTVVRHLRVGAWHGITSRQTHSVGTRREARRCCGLCSEKGPEPTTGGADDGLGTLLATVDSSTGCMRAATSETKRSVNLDDIPVHGKTLHPDPSNRGTPTSWRISRNNRHALPLCGMNHHSISHNHLAHCCSTLLTVVACTLPARHSLNCFLYRECEISVSGCTRPPFKLPEVYIFHGTKQSFAGHQKLCPPSPRRGARYHDRKLLRTRGQVLLACIW